MRKTGLGLVVATCAVMMLFARPANAALMVTITQGASSTSCDTLVGGCGAGWTIIDANNLLFTGTVGGYSIAALDLSANVPGSSTLAESLDTKNRVTNVSAAGGSLMVDSVAYGYTSPIGNTLLSGAQTANWAVASAGDSSSFSASGSSTNSKVWPGGVVVPTPTIVNATADTTTSFSSNSGQVPFATGAGPYSLLGREIITEAVGSTGSFSATITNQASAVPEPASVLLLGTGLIALARRRSRNRPTA